MARDQGFGTVIKGYCTDGLLVVRAANAMCAKHLRKFASVPQRFDHAVPSACPLPVLSVLWELQAHQEVRIPFAYNEINGSNPL